MNRRGFLSLLGGPKVAPLRVRVREATPLPPFNCKRGFVKRDTRSFRRATSCGFPSDGDSISGRQVPRVPAARAGGCSISRAGRPENTTTRKGCKLALMRPRFGSLGRHRPTRAARSVTAGPASASTPPASPERLTAEGGAAALFGEGF
jgi:hypothetical protein